MSRPHGSTAPSDPCGLPLYPWQRERFWFGRTVEAAEPVNPVCDHPLLGFRQDRCSARPGSITSIRRCFRFLPITESTACRCCPRRRIIDMALAAARMQPPEAAVLELRDVELLHGRFRRRGTRDAEHAVAGRRLAARQPQAPGGRGDDRARDRASRRCRLRRLPRSPKRWQRGKDRCRGRRCTGELLG